MVRVVADQQKDNLCGPFCAARILHVEQDLVALRAGTTLPIASDTAGVPRGAHSYTDYMYELPSVPEIESGTSPAGLMSAIESLTDHALEGVPVRGGWTTEQVERLVERAPSIEARLIANLRTGLLWGSRPSPQDLVAELNGHLVSGPPPEWDVGHYVELTGLVHGHAGSLVVVHDTYPELGWKGYHLQPPRTLAAALRRGDGREGGVLVIVAAERAHMAVLMARALGLEVGAWDNGCRR